MRVKRMSLRMLIEFPHSVGVCFVNTLDTRLDGGEYGHDLRKVLKEIRLGNQNHLHCRLSSLDRTE